MLEIRTTLSWNKIDDPEVLRAIMNQPEITRLPTPVGVWVLRMGKLIGLLHEGVYYERPAEVKSDVRMHVSEAPPTRAQRTADMVWMRPSNGEKRTWNGTKWV